MKADKARSMVLGCAVISTAVTCANEDPPHALLAPPAPPDHMISSAATVPFSSTAVAQHSGRCMDVFGADTGDGVNLIQWNCHGGNNQSFTFTPVAGTTNTYTISTFSAGKCIAVTGGSTADNASVVQTACAGSASQQFRLVRDHLIQKGPSFPRPIDMTIDVARGQVTSGTAMTMGSRRSSPNR